MFLALAQMLQPAHAAPITASTTGVLSGERGADVLVGLQVDSLLEFVAADLLLVYDPDVLVLRDIPAQMPNTLLQWGPPEAYGSVTSRRISYIIETNLISGMNLDFLSLLFNIRSDAAFGPTMVQLLSLDSSSFDLSPLRFAITVLQPTVAVPLPPSSSLVLLALGAAALASRRRTPAIRAQAGAH